MALDWKLTASRNDLLRELEKVNNSLAKQASRVQDLQNKVKQSNREANRGARSRNKFLMEQINLLKGTAAGLLGVVSAERLITSELEHQKTLRRDALMARRSVAASESGVIINMGRATPQQADAMIRDLRQLAVKTGIEVPHVNTAMGG